MARLPIPGSDKGQWGEILNTFLRESHNEDGSLKGVVATNDPRLSDTRTPTNNSVSTAKIQDNAVTDDKLAAGSANAGQFLSHNGTSMVWTTVSNTTVSDATAAAKGVVQLAGDLSGTAGAPVVSRVNGISLPGSAPTNGQVLTATGATTTSWQTPSVAPVTSVAGKTGVVNLAKADVGLSAVDNTSDLDKPISQDVQDALDGKQAAGSYAAASHTHAISDVTNLTPTLASKLSTAELTNNWGVLPTLYWNGTSWPSRTIPDGYSGAVTWDSASDASATPPSASIAGDRWLRRIL